MKSGQVSASGCPTAFLSTDNASVDVTVPLLLTSPQSAAASAAAVRRATRRQARTIAFSSRGILDIVALLLFGGGRRSPGCRRRRDCHRRRDEMFARASPLSRFAL